MIFFIRECRENVKIIIYYVMYYNKSIQRVVWKYKFLDEWKSNSKGIKGKREQKILQDQMIVVKMGVEIEMW